MADVSLSVRVNANLEEMRAKMKDAQAVVDTTSSAMRSMANAYDGTRTIANANAAMLQVQALGGVTQLTDAEQVKLNAALQAGIEKYEAMGREAPQGMREMADATARVEKEHVNLSSTLKDVAAAFGLVWSLDRSVDFIKSIVEEADRLGDLSLQTQINVTDIQLLSAATRQYGVDGEQLGLALYQLGRRIAGNDDSVAHAYHLMGMSIKDVKDLDPMALFLATERGLGTLQGAIRDTAASDLFGGKLGVSLSAFSTKVDEALDRARRFSHFASEDSVQAAGDFADAMDAATKSLHAFSIEAIGPIAQGFNVLTDATDKGATKWQLFTAMLKDWATSSLVTGGNATHLATLLDQLNQQAARHADIQLQDSAATAQATAQLDAQGRAAKFMAALQADALQELLPWQVQYLEQLKSIGQLNAANAAGIGVSADQFKRYEDATRDAAQAAKEWHEAVGELATVGADFTGTLGMMNGTVVEAVKYYLQAGVSQHALAVAYGETATHISAVAAALKEEKAAADVAMASNAMLAKAQQDYYQAVNSASHDSVQAQIDDIYAATAAKVAAMQSAKGYTLEAEMFEWAAADATVDHIIQKNLEADTSTRAHYQLVADQAEIAYRRAAAAIDQYTPQEIQRLREVAEAARFAADTWGMSFQQAGAKAAKAVSDAATAAIADWQRMSYMLTGGSPVPGKFKDWTDEQLRSAGYIDAQGRVTALGAAAGLGVGPGGLPARAEGGPVTAGQPYLVGERGPEVFVPGASGTIVPNRSLSPSITERQAPPPAANGGAGAPTVINHIYVNGTIKDLAVPLMNEITRTLKQSRQFPAA